MPTFIDIQLNPVESGYIMKELALLDTNSQLSHYVIKPPFKYTQLTNKEKYQLNWVHRNHSDLSWNAGEHPYHSISKILNNELGNRKEILLRDWRKKFGLSNLEHM